MSITLLNALIAYSRELGDYWAGTTTSNGNALGTTLVDTALKAQTSDWINEGATDLITSGTYIDNERKVSNLDSYSGSATTLAHGGQIVAGVTYQIHRLWSASDKRNDLVQATKSVFPYLHKRIRSVALTTGTGATKNKVDISTLGIMNNNPNKVVLVVSTTQEHLIRDWYVDQGFLYLPYWVPESTSLRIEGITYLDFLKTGAVSTAWDATIDLTDAQLKILVAEAAIYLYQQKISQFTSGEYKSIQERLNYWKMESADRKQKYGMILPKVYTNWGGIC